MSQPSEFTMLGPVLAAYNDAMTDIDALATIAAEICKETEPKRAAQILVGHMALMEALNAMRGLLDDRKRREN